MSARSLTAHNLPCRSATAASDRDSATHRALPDPSPELDTSTPPAYAASRKSIQITLSLPGIRAQIEPGLRKHVRGDIGLTMSCDATPYTS